ncbi:MAG: hypothetical protein AB8G17_09475 [Gammaproteobacteria bacterium]
MSLIHAQTPPWLRRFERIEVPAGRRITCKVADCAALVVVVHGVLELATPLPALRRVLPGEMALVRGHEHLALMNGSKRQSLSLALATYADPAPSLPSSAVRYFPDDDQAGALCPVVNRDGREGSLRHESDLRVFVTSLAPGETVLAETGEGIEVFAHVLEGVARINQTDLEPGANVLISKESEMRMTGVSASKILLLEQTVK